MVIGLVQLAVFTITVINVNWFLLVVLNYMPVMVFFLIMNIVRRKSFAGAGWMITGVVISFVASGIQMAHISQNNPFNHNCYYHVGMMVAVIFFGLGGAKFRNEK